MMKGFGMKEKMIISACGFCWSGSGAVLDYLMEFDENQVYKEEFDIAYHPDGLADLDYNLNYNCSKFLSSGVAIPRFKKVANMLLDKRTNGESKKIIKDYLDKLIQVSWVGCEEGQVLIHNQWLYNKIGMRIRYYLIPRLSREFCIKHKIYPLDNMYFSVQPDGFIEKTQDFTDKILTQLGFDMEKNIVLNQAFPGNRPTNSMKYYRNAKAIVVDRDPRDVYIFLKAVFPNNSFSVPLDNVENFIAYFKNMHKTINKEITNNDVLYICFEDLIYEYENTIQKLNAFLDLKNHTYPKKYFKPEKSIANTQVFLRYPEYRQDIKRIECELKEYLYSFESYDYQYTNEDMFDDNPESEKYDFKKK